MRPILRKLFPEAGRDAETLSALSANVTANLLGLGNAATPMGIRAAERMARGCGETASDELCKLVVLNTASIQLFPATVAALRSAAGCATPLDILPAVWLTSLVSVCVGLLTERLLARVSKGKAFSLRGLSGVAGKPSPAMRGSAARQRREGATKGGFPLRVAAQAGKEKSLHNTGKAGGGAA